MANQTFFYNDIYVENEYDIFTGTGIQRYGHATKWYVHGKLHRENDPAVEWIDGEKEYWQYGKRHRENGPAVEESDGTLHYWFCGILYTLKDYLKLLKLDKLPSSS